MKNYRIETVTMDDVDAKDASYDDYIRGRCLDVLAHEIYQVPRDKVMETIFNTCGGTADVAIINAMYLAYLRLKD